MEIVFWVIVAFIILGGGAFGFLLVEDFHPIYFILCLIAAAALVFMHLQGDLILLSQQILSVPAESVQSAISHGKGGFVFDFFTVPENLFWLVFVVGSLLTTIFWFSAGPNVSFTALVLTVISLLLINHGPEAVLAWLRAKIYWVPVCFVGYFSASVPVGILKWYLYNMDHNEEFEDECKVLLNHFGRSKIQWNEDQRREWENQLLKKELYASEHKGMITGWLAYWPLHLVDTLIREILFKIIKRIYIWILPILDKISARAASKIKIPETTE